MPLFEGGAVQRPRMSWEVAWPQRWKPPDSWPEDSYYHPIQWTLRIGWRRDILQLDVSRNIINMFLRTYVHRINSDLWAIMWSYDSQYIQTTLSNRSSVIFFVVFVKNYLLNRKQKFLSETTESRRWDSHMTPKPQQKSYCISSTQLKSPNLKSHSPTLKLPAKEPTEPQHSFDVHIHISEISKIRCYI